MPDLRLAQERDPDDVFEIPSDTQSSSEEATTTSGSTHREVSIHTSAGPPQKAAAHKSYGSPILGSPSPTSRTSVDTHRSMKRRRGPEPTEQRPTSSSAAFPRSTASVGRQQPHSLGTDSRALPEIGIPRTLDLMISARSKVRVDETDTSKPSSSLDPLSLQPSLERSSSGTQRAQQKEPVTNQDKLLILNAIDELEEEQQEEVALFIQMEDPASLNIDDFTGYERALMIGSLPDEMLHSLLAYVKAANTEAPFRAFATAPTGKPPSPCPTSMQPPGTDEQTPANLTTPQQSTVGVRPRSSICTPSDSSHLTTVALEDGLMRRVRKVTVTSVVYDLYPTEPVRF